jgi:hypothetical protein
MREPIIRSPNDRDRGEEKGSDYPHLTPWLGDRGTRIVGRLVKAPDGTWQFPVLLGEGLYARKIMLTVRRAFDPASPEPTRIFDEDPSLPHGLWQYRGVVVSVGGGAELSLDEALLQIKHAVLRHDKKFERMRREVEAFENIERADASSRERIPDSVRLFVWQRDQGRCVRCGSQERLEFDHIIPVVKGGSNTERNIQLLCERCNRSKGAGI